MSIQQHHKDNDQRTEDDMSQASSNICVHSSLFRESAKPVLSLGISNWNFIAMVVLQVMES